MGGWVGGTNAKRGVNVHSATHPPTHSTLSCSNMTGTISPKGDIAMVNIANGVYNTPWPKATVMRKAGKLR